MPLTLDPTLPHMGAALLSIVFLSGGWQKLRNIDSFAMAIEQYQLLPASLAPGAAWGMLAAELAAGVLLLPIATRELGAALALLVLVVVTAAVAINLMRGRRAIDCGCGGPEGSQHLSWGLVLRNGLLSLSVGLAVTSETQRELVWLDGVTVVVGTLAMYGLYAAANQLMANQPRLLKLKG